MKMWIWLTSIVCVRTPVTGSHSLPQEASLHMQNFKTVILILRTFLIVKDSWEVSRPLRISSHYI